MSWLIAIAALAVITIIVVLEGRRAPQVCPRCGSELDAEMTRCDRCGEELE
jgi:predicted amidophosphoribosyltransferase